MDTKNLKAGFDSFLDNKVSRLNKNHKIAICAATVLVPVVLFYFLYFGQRGKEITVLQGQVATMSQELESIKRQAAKLKEQKTLMKEMELKFKAAAEVMPNTKEIPKLLTNISNQGTSAGLDILTFTPSGEKPKEFYSEIPVSLSMRGTYHNLGHFLDTVSKLPRIVNVVNVKLSSPKMTEGEMLLSAKVNLVTYKFVEPKTDPEDSGKKKKKKKKNKKG